MPSMYLLPDGSTVREGQAFTLGEVSYPRNWLGLSTPEDRAALQIALQPPESPPQATPPTVQVLLEHLSVMRWQAENAGTMWGQITLPTDRERRSALKDAADKIRDGTLTTPIAVAFSSAVYATVTLEQLDAAVNLITQYVQKVFSDALTVASQVMAGTITTYEALADAWNEIRNA